MNTHYACVTCGLNGIINLFKLNLIEEQYREKVFKAVLSYYSELDFSLHPLVVNRDLHRIIREISNNPDPYKPLKDEYNNIALDIYYQFRNEILAAPDSITRALRLAMGGNIIDFAPGHKIDVPELVKEIFSLELAVDDSQSLIADLKNAKSVLYLADNTGEIVFDKLLIEAVNHPNLTLAVRHSPVLNDATMEDTSTLGIDKIVKVITNGDNAAGTLLEDVSEEFLDVFNKADLIISKGMGNFEGLCHLKDKNIYFLLMAKCDLIANDLGVKKGDFVIKSAKKQLITNRNSC